MPPAEPASRLGTPDLGRWVVTTASQLLGLISHRVGVLAC